MKFCSHTKRIEDRTVNKRFYVCHTSDLNLLMLKLKPYTQHTTSNQWPICDDDMCIDSYLGSVSFYLLYMYMNEYRFRFD